MTLTTHAVAGAAIVSLMPHHPVAGVVLAFASHFALDTIPHWDYPISSGSVHPDVGAKMRFDMHLVKDMARIGFDALLGLVLALTFFTPYAAFWIIALGAIAGMVPDPLQFVYAHFKHEPLVTLQRFHKWVHTKNHLEDKVLLGVVSQLALITFIIAVTQYLHK